MARPAKPMCAATDLDAAFDDLDAGSLTYEGAEQFTGLSRDEIERAVRQGEIETFNRGRRVLLVRRSVQLWLARMLAEARAERLRG